MIVGNQNAITYKEVFPLIKENKIWLGKGFHRSQAHFYTPYVPQSKWIEQEGDHIVRVAGVQWFTNMDHGRRHEPLALMTQADNIKFSKHKEVKGVGYKTYDNYDGIEVPFTDAIPSDFEGVMGVPITFLTKYNPDQFELVGFWNTGKAGEQIGATLTEAISAGKPIVWNGPTVNSETKYFRILIRHKKVGI